VSQQNQQSIPAAEDPSVPEAKIMLAADRVFYEREDGQVFSTTLENLRHIALEDNAQTNSLTRIEVVHEEDGLLPVWGDVYNPAPGTREGDALDEFTDLADGFDLAPLGKIRDAA
jgi:hypothetical protein